MQVLVNNQRKRLPKSPGKPPARVHRLTKIGQLYGYSPVVGGEAKQYRKSSVISRTRIHPPYLRTPNNFNPLASRIAFISKDN
ncbi:hypothetical protein VN97_g5697 [Penicillium thymicola]|uniref:Uncharacterized protein n=1 Tax=Penicillium thymicola TaxID=293382 RepID=A0AAI9TI42_PENTH|nr:hypothetical protein VN97_g5697 [Penicillium thymicola]